MAMFHMTEAEMLRDPATLLARVSEGDEIVIDHDTLPLAIIRPAAPPRRRTLAETLAALDTKEAARGPAAEMDDEFAADMRAIIASHKPSKPAWD